MNFNNLEQLNEFLMNKRNNDEIPNQKIKKPKKENDRRGLYIKELHQKAKEYKLKNPELSYKECLKFCNTNENLANNNNNE